VTGLRIISVFGGGELFASPLFLFSGAITGGFCGLTKKSFFKSGGFHFRFGNKILIFSLNFSGF
jgi:hypothetical protein